jgi:hypothetical protein
MDKKWNVGYEECLAYLSREIPARWSKRERQTEVAKSLSAAYGANGSDEMLTSSDRIDEEIMTIGQFFATVLDSEILAGLERYAM